MFRRDCLNSNFRKRDNTISFVKLILIQSYWYLVSNFKFLKGDFELLCLVSKSTNYRKIILKRF